MAGRPREPALPGGPVAIGEATWTPTGNRSQRGPTAATADERPTGRSPAAAEPNLWTRRPAVEPRTSPPTPPRVLFELDEESGEWLPVGIAGNAAEAAAFIHGCSSSGAPSTSRHSDERGARHRESPAAVHRGPDGACGRQESKGAVPMGTPPGDACQEVIDAEGVGDRWLTWRTPRSGSASSNRHVTREAWPSAGDPERYRRVSQALLPTATSRSMGRDLGVAG